MNTSRDIIQTLGGTAAVASALGKDWKTVHNWTRPGRRISSNTWLSIAALKEAEEKKITVELLASLQPNPLEQAA